MTEIWEESIPNELHGAFIRQIDEAVAAELMRIFRIAEESEGAPVDEDEIKQQLTATFVQKYVGLFEQRLWPPKESSNLGIVQTEHKPMNMWICTSCKSKNPNSFETCQKCSENKPESSRPSLNSAPVYNSEPQKPAMSSVRGPTKVVCRDCRTEYPLGTTDCENCQESLDPNRRHNWPSPLIIRDPATRHDLRQRLFMAIREELDLDDPFSDVAISHEEFFEVLERLKSQIIESVTAPISHDIESARLESIS